MLIGTYYSFSRIGFAAVLIGSFLFSWRYRSTFFLWVPVSAILLMGVFLGNKEPVYTTKSLHPVAIRLSNHVGILRSLTIRELVLGIGVRSFVSYQSKRCRGTANPVLKKRYLCGKVRYRAGNLFITLLIEQGIFSLLIFCFPLFTTMKTIAIYAQKVHKEGQSLLWAIWCGLFAFILNLGSANLFNIFSMHLLFWGILGLGLGFVMKNGGQRGFYQLVNFDGNAEPL